jgi:hypothetical protein
MTRPALVSASLRPHKSKVTQVQRSAESNLEKGIDAEYQYVSLAIKLSLQLFPFDERPYRAVKTERDEMMCWCVQRIRVAAAAGRILAGLYCELPPLPAFFEISLASFYLCHGHRDTYVVPAFGEVVKSFSMS